MIIALKFLESQYFFAKEKLAENFVTRERLRIRTFRFSRDPVYQKETLFPVLFACLGAIRDWKSCL